MRTREARFTVFVRTRPYDEETNDKLLINTQGREMHEEHHDATKLHDEGKEGWME